MSDTKQPEMSEAEILAKLAEADAEGAPMPATFDGAPTARAKEQTDETPETDEQGQSEESEESPEAGTESEEETEEQSEETKDEGIDKTEQPQQEQKPLTKAEKDAARAAKAWKDIEAKKAEIAREREEIAKAKAEIELTKAKKPEPIKDQHGYSAEEYDAFVKDAERENAEAVKAGNDPRWSPQAIERARANAEILRARAQFETAENQRKAAEAEVQLITKEYPDLTKPDSPMAKAMQSVWEGNREFWTGKPGAMRVMAELAAARVKADSVPALEKKLTELTKEVKRLTGLTSPSKGGQMPVSRMSSKKDDPTDAEIESHLADLDRQGIPLASF